MQSHCLLFACRAVLPWRIETKEGGRTGRAAQPISDNTHSVSPSHTNTPLLTMHWTGLDYLSQKCSRVPINTKMRTCLLLLQPIRSRSAPLTQNVLKVDQQKTIRDINTDVLENDHALIKSLVISGKYIN